MNMKTMKNFTRSAIVVLLFVISNSAMAQGLLINELMASNSKTILDKDFKSYSDWIEIFNSGSSSVNLKDYFITDDLTKPQKYKIPTDLIVPANGYALVWADDAGSANHANFKLSASGESLGLFDPSVQLIDSVTFGEQQSDVSFGRIPNGSANWYKLAPATPGSVNVETGILNLLTPPTISINSGFYSSSLNVSASHTQAGVTIRYTVDGSTPIETSTVYQFPIRVDSTTVLRFRAFKNGFTSSLVESRTYFINEKSDLPVFSLVTDPSNFFSDVTGIYVAGKNGVTSHCSTGPRNWNQDWERPVNLEFFEADKSLAFKINAGVKIYGGCTRLYAQKSLAFYMRPEYGDDKLHYRLFDDEPISEFNNFILRSSGQDWWRTMFRDGMVHTLVEQGMKIDYSNYRPSILFINGKYWGIHNIREKMNEHYTFYHQGADKDNIDFIEISKEGRATNGDAIAYNDMMNFFSTKDMTNPANYEYIKSIVDIDEYMDYQITEIYGANGDWPGSNMKLWRERKSGSKWRWLLYDTDFTFGGNSNGMYNSNTLELATATNGSSWPNPPWSTLMLRKLLENAEFKNEFIQRFAAHMNTTFETNHVLAVIDSMAKDIASEIPRHKLRWPQSISYGTGWQSQIDIMKTFAVNRPSNMRAHIYAKFGISTSNSLVISRNNPAWGKVLVYSVEIKKNGSTNLFFKGIPIRIKALALPGYRFVRWEGVSSSASPEISIVLDKNTSLTAVFEEMQTSQNSVVINEINYNSSSVFDTEDWIEFYNPNSAPVEISNWRFQDEDISHQFVFSNGFTIGARDYLVLCRDTTKFRKLYPAHKKMIGNINFGLSGDGESIYLIDNLGKTVDEVTYSSSGLWNQFPNGSGATLSLINYQLDNSQPTSWKSSRLYGTPGLLNDVYTKIGSEENTIPSEFVLFQNYPNPFNPTTLIKFVLPVSAEIKLTLYDPLGREIAILMNGYLTAGTHQVEFDKNRYQISSGIYFYKLEYAGNFLVKKMILLK